ncbi:MAG: FlaD/FlaE family flagellar protein [Salinirussus sp.]
MSIDPRDATLTDLRQLAAEREATGNGDGELRMPGTETTAAPLRDGLYRELAPLGVGAGGLEKPYLPALPEAYIGEQFVFEWLEFLQQTAGYQGAAEALSYYESIGWLTPAVTRQLQDYMLGVEGSAGGDDLDIDDHLLSLAYIAKLASMRQNHND